MGGGRIATVSNIPTSKTIDTLLHGIMQRIPASVTPNTRIELHPSEWMNVAAEVELLRGIAYECLSDMGAIVARGCPTGATQSIVGRLYVLLNGETPQQTTDRQVREDGFQERIRQDEKSGNG